MGYSPHLTTPYLVCFSKAETRWGLFSEAQAAQPPRIFKNGYTMPNDMRLAIKRWI